MRDKSLKDPLQEMYSTMELPVKISTDGIRLSGRLIAIDFKEVHIECPLPLEQGVRAEIVAYVAESDFSIEIAGWVSAQTSNPARVWLQLEPPDESTRQSIVAYNLIATAANLIERGL